MLSIIRSRGWILLIVAVLMGSSWSVAFGSSEGHADASTANATPAQSDPLELRTDYAVFTLIVFVILLVVLYVLAWKPLIQSLDLREHTIATQLAEAKLASETAAAKLKEYEAKLSEAAVQAQEIVVAARKDSVAVGERLKAEAQAEASRLLERAKSEIETAKLAALSDLTTKSTDIAFSLARQVVGRELKADDHQKLISDALSKLPSNN